jgi:hypothetical protein
VCDRRVDPRLLRPINGAIGLSDGLSLARSGSTNSTTRDERAGLGEATEYAFLSSEPVSEVGDINSQTEFDTEQLDQTEFENACVVAAPIQ